MSYIDILKLKRDPFSNSPDPEVFYNCRNQVEALERLESAIMMKRGLNILAGPVGTGKTTLLRRLLQRLDQRHAVESFLLFDAGTVDSVKFVRELIELIGGTVWEGTDLQAGLGVLQEIIFKKALEGRQTLVLLIDEGQKLTPECFEVLRVLLNFETNTEKLLQIVVFGQPEMEETIHSMPNLKDRVNEYLTLHPFNETESLAMLRYRLNLAGGEDGEKLFTKASLKRIYKEGSGHPRQMVRLAHQALTTLVMRSGKCVTPDMIEHKGQKDSSVKRSLLLSVSALLVVAVLGAGYTVFTHQKESPRVFAQMRLPGISLPATQSPQASAQIKEPAATATVPAASAPAVHETVMSAPVAVTSPTQAPSSTSAEPAQTSQTAPAQLAPEPKPEAQNQRQTTASEIIELTQEPEIEVAVITLPKLPKKLPQTLGTITEAEGFELREIAQFFYGNKRVIKKLRNANPSFKGEPGQKIRLITERYPVPATLTGRYLIVLNMFEKADDVLNDVADYLDYSPTVLPVYSRGGFRFMLLARENFANREEAIQWLKENKLPQEANAQVLAPLSGKDMLLRDFR